MRNTIPTNAHTETAITKMEKAIFISRIGNLKYFSPDYSRLYFGNEFCERLIHPKKDLDKVISFVKEKNISFTYVTPYTTNPWLKIIKENVLHISKKLENLEIVINDWGVLRATIPYGIQPVLGRLLAKMKRGPRILDAVKNSPAGMIEHFRKSNLEVPIFQDYLGELGIKRAEFDNVLQGIDIDFSDSKLKGSLYYPYVYLTTTRRCLSNSCDLLSKRDIIGIYPCNRECQKYTLELTHEVMPKRIILKGNSQFMENEKIPADLEEKGINRLVYQPEVPM